MTIGEKIFKYRKQARLSQEELADKMNVTRQSISLWETDQTTPSLDNLIMLAEIFTISLDELCGTQSTKGVAPAQTDRPEKSECLAVAQTKYTVDLINNINKLSAKKFFIPSIIVIILSILSGISVIISDTDNVYLITPIFLVVLFAALLIGFSISHKKRATEFFKLHPNCVAKVRLFQNRLDLEMTSDNADSKSTIQYSDIKKVKNNEKCILIYYGNAVVPIEKNLPDTNYDLILKLLNAPNATTVKPQNKKIKALLLTMFILSLLSIFMALAATGIAVQSSPLPDFPYALPEYMWVFFIFIALPLASAVLGIVFYTKKYKCKKNIIAGFIMCAVLAVYGSFTFIYKDNNIHNFGYVSELEQTISIDLPDSGYISRAKNIDSATKSVAMIKFDDANEIYNTVSSDERFYTDTNFIPSNLIDMSYVILTSNYHYFMLFDVTDDENDVEITQHRYIFLAYNVDKNILFALDFVK